MRRLLAAISAIAFLSIAACEQTHASSGTPSPTPVSLPQLPLSTLTVSSVSASSLDLSWAPAFDPSHPGQPLRYAVYHSTADDISTLNTLLANGALDFGPAVGVYTTHVTGLQASTPYWFNVVVLTSAGVEAVYDSTPVVTKTPAVFLFATYPVDGGFGGRGPADAKCASMRQFAYQSLPCSNDRAFVATGAPDGQLFDFPTLFAVPDTRPIQGPTGLVLATNWTALMSGSIANSVGAATGISGHYWTGSDSNGGASNACFSGSVWQPGGGSGQAGDSAATGATWLNDGPVACTEVHELLCICW